jgi:flavin reductase (DIM6/NTAB) family NADH-FMN oxidoreductase RutF
MKKILPKESLSTLKPKLCVFVISVDEGGKPSGMIAAWHTQCSADPAFFMVSLSKKGNTQKLIRQSKEFVVAVANKELEDAVVLFGSTHGDDVDKFLESGIETEVAEFIKSPLVKKATFNFECELFKEVDCGDHVIFIGKVLSAYHNEGKKVLFNTDRVDGKRVFEEF